MSKELKITNGQTLDHNLKNVKVDETSSGLSLSKEKVKTKDLEVDGTLTVNGPINGALRSDGELNLEDVQSKVFRFLDTGHYILIRRKDE